SRACPENIHQYLECGGLAGSVWTYQRIDAALGNLEIESTQRGYPAKLLRKITCSDWRVHSLRPPLPASTSSGSVAESSRFQWLLTAANTSSRFIPSFLASTTSCSISVPSNWLRSAGVASGSCATRVPIPGRTSISPSATRWLTTLWAVFGLIFSSLLKAR